MKDMDIKAVFIGDKAENGAVYKMLLNKMVDEHLGWRENYLPGDLPAISEEDKLAPQYIATRERMMTVLDEVSERMRAGSIPWHSAGRYWGQMNAETLMPSLLAYNYAMLWNPNNVALESSMATSQIEAEVGQDFADLFNMTDGWGHITADGSIANLEGLWYARCIKSIPLAVKEVFPEKVENKTEWELLNLSVEEILEMIEKFTDEELDAVKAASSRSGKHIQELGKWLVPQTKHYSWMKALDICGVGLDQMIAIPVQEDYRMDVAELEKTIRELAEQKIPILGVVAVVGTTEEGQVDSVDKIVELREKLRGEGIYFYLHVDAAYGGYARSLFLNEAGEFVPYESLTEFFEEHQVFHHQVKIDKSVYDGFKAITEADSVTIDPHKMGYVPYAAGGIVIKHKNMRNIISYFAPYVFEKSVKAPDMLGAYILEGSKAGATAAAVWTAHRVLPLNVTGYGQLIGASIEAAQRFREFLGQLSFTVKGKTIEVHPLNHPDFNMVDWVFKVQDCTDLKKINDLNEKMFDVSSYMDGDVYDERFITSHTTFTKADYGDSPVKFIESLGLSKEEWQKEQQVTLLRAAIMTPYLNDDKIFKFYTDAITKAIEKKLNELL
ncbi:tyrosine decarboxylase [Enterococcus durans]|uniref:tyrosine decarboxylase n=1 Tax=Enterococcus durans TaxID=53345 RepID=UPI0021A84E08|nr:tyrosine decarboxylase [Enterococcus durans]MCT4340106.1 tyrosine decarboxylase [Enterococcus durans]